MTTYVNFLNFKFSKHFVYLALPQNTWRFLLKQYFWILNREHRLDFRRISEISLGLHKLIFLTYTVSTLFLNLSSKFAFCAKCQLLLFSNCRLLVYLVKKKSLWNESKEAWIPIAQKKLQQFPWCLPERSQKELRKSSGVMLWITRDKAKYNQLWAEDCSWLSNVYQQWSFWWWFHCFIFLLLFL